LLTEEQQKILLKKLPAMPARARELKQIRDEKSDGRMRISDVWSNIQAAGTWTGGSCSIFFEKLKSEFTAKTLLRDAGYLASEMRGTFPIFSKTSAGIPTFRENYFEFVERDAWENGRKEFLSLTELKDKTEYYIFVTTDAGLYRYNMNDIVKVDGFHGQAPLLRFMQKGKGVTNITGEKVYESQIIAATKAMEAEMGISSSFYMAVASEAELVYRLFYEADRDSIAKLMDQKSTAAALCDKLLGELNIEYRAKRESGRLRPIELVPIEIGTYDLYKRHSIERGQRESQFKIVALLPASDVSFNFSNHKASKVSGRHPLRSESAEAQIS
jgi:hypothetical protein